MAFGAFKEGVQARDREGITVLGGVDLAVRRDKVFGLIAPKGASKTSLIKMLCMPPAHGWRCSGQWHDLPGEHIHEASVGLVTVVRANEHHHTPCLRWAGDSGQKEM